MQRSTDIFRLDKFLGLNESDASETELRIGESPEMVNWEITENYNLKRRPGLAKLTLRNWPNRPEETAITGIWSGVIGDTNYVLITQHYIMGFPEGYREELVTFKVLDDGTLEYIGEKFQLETDWAGHQSKIFYLNGNLYADTATNIWAVSLEDGKFSADHAQLYEPILFTGSKPAGGGEELEQVNILTDGFRLQYSGDGAATEYKLPEITSAVSKALVDGVEVEGSYEPTTHTFTFASPPIEGVNNVEFLCLYDDKDLTAARKKFFACPFYEHFNGATDTRVFFYGDGTNTALYTGVPAFGSGLYVPAGNEIAVDSSAAPITGMIRQDATLMCFKTDGTYRISYDPVTLAGGKVIAGLFVRNVSKEIGNDVPGQVRLVNNYSRTIHMGTLYEWHSTAAYKDQRYTKDISARVRRTLSAARSNRIVTADDEVNKKYYIVLNDEQGTVLVNRYDIDVWYLFQSGNLKNIRYATAIAGTVVFASDAEIIFFDPEADFDCPSLARAAEEPIRAVWESGFMHFGSDWRKKYSSEIWVSTLPEPSSRMTITVNTDKRNGYARKVVGNNIFDWYNNVDYANWSYNVSRTPKMKRTKLKVKKFVYYKLIFDVESPGARSTVLAADIRVHFAGPVK